MDDLPNHASANLLIPKAVMNAAMLSDKINICHMNVQSLCARRFTKFEELKQNIIGSKLDIICFTETWLDTSINDSLIAIQGFDVVRNDRNRHGGGICVYFNQKRLTCRILKNSNNLATNEGRYTTEFLILEVICGDSKFLLAVYYNPPTLDCSYSLRSHIEEFCMNYERSYFIGDFNTDIRFQNRRTNEFVETISSMSLSCINNEPTFYHNNGSSLLDLLLTDAPDSVLKCNQISMSGVSNHDLVFATLDITSRRESVGYWFRDYYHYEQESLNVAFNRINLNEFKSIHDSDILLNILNNHLYIIHEQIFPLRFKKSQCNSWFNSDIERAIINRDLAYRNWKNCKTSANRVHYNRMRNLVTSLIRQAKYFHDRQRINTNLPVKQLWKNIKNIGISSSELSNSSSAHSAEEINNYFASNFSEIDNSIIHYSHSQNSFHFGQIDCNDIIISLFSIKSNAVGLDLLPLKFLQTVLPLALPFIHHLFNTIISTSKFPSQWKRVKVIPILKKRGNTDIMNLRPISLLSVLSKAFEKIVKDQISQFIADMNYLHPFQSGFRKNHSTETALMKVHDDVALAIDKKGVAILLLIDFAKAFDRVSHARLINKLISRYNFSDSAAKLIESYLKDRYQSVFSNSTFSPFILCESGVPQGSILGPLLFSLFINDLPLVLRHCSVHLFADDVQIYYCVAPNLNMSVVCENINYDLEQVINWSVSNLLPINPSKTKALLIHNQRETPETPIIKMNGIVINFVDEANNLGVIFKNNLAWDAQINSQCRKIYIALKQLNMRTRHLDTAIKLKLFKTLIFPHFIYSDFIYSNALGASLDRLRIALNACVRYVYNLNRYSRVSHLQANLVGCNFSKFCKYRSCVLLHRIIRSRLPHYLYEKLIPFRNTRTQSYVIPNHNSFYYSQSFFARGIVNWNSLPTSIKLVISKYTFKHDLLTYLNNTNN